MKCKIDTGKYYDLTKTASDLLVVPIHGMSLIGLHAVAQTMAASVLLVYIIVTCVHHYLLKRR